MSCQTKFWGHHYLLSTKFWMMIILGVGLMVRISLVFLTLHNTDHTRMDSVEPYFIATSLAEHGTYADAFGPGTGPSAHTTPVLPLLMALIIRIVGGGLAGYLARSILSSIVSSAAYALLPLLAVRCRMGILPGVIAGLVGAAVPFNFYNQIAGDFDQPYTMLGLVIFCCLLSVYWVQASFPVRGGILLGLFCGLLCLLSPVVSQVLIACFLFGLLCFAGKRREFSIFMATVVALIVICLSPWAYRNYKALGKVIWTRSNFGLELSVSNNDNASADYEVNVMSPSSPHPFSQAKENERIRRMGELAYNQARLKEALTWIRSHPARFAQLSVQRYTLFWFPIMRRWWQTAALILISIVAIAGLFDLLRKRHPAAWMFLAILLSYPAVHTVIEVGPRYRLPIEPILLLLTGWFCVSLWNKFAVAPDGN